MTHQQPPSRIQYALFSFIYSPGSQKSLLLLRRSAILAELFYITGNKGSCYIKKDTAKETVSLTVS
ncbi:hypothetical protein CLOM621_06344 [Clostridium sp. M62/1]|nr:hypothetical protein CLOM621_06344 [Clostridium sp. M62/1]